MSDLHRKPAEYGRSRAFRAALIVAVSVSLLLTGCGGKTQPQSQPAQAPVQENTGAPAEGGEFVFGIATEVNNLDPFTSTTADARGVYFNIYEGLVKTSPEGEMVPAVADEVTVSEDASVYTFHLRDGVKFHNGENVTMQDVLSSVQRAVDADLAGYKAIESFAAKDDSTLEIVLKAPDTGFLAYMTTAIVPEKAQDLALNPIGTGPFAFAEYAEQDHITLKKFADYWGTPAHLDQVTIKMISGSAEQLIAFQAGSIDGFEGAAGITEQLDKSQVVEHVRNSNSVQVLVLNNAEKPFDDVRVRQALCYAVDQQQIIDFVNYGYGVKAGNPVIPGLKKYYNDETTEAYPKDNEKAKQLLKEAGYENGFKFTISVPSVYQVHVDTAQVLVNQLAEIGVTAEIQLVDWATWKEKVYANRQYEATIISFDGSIAYPTAFLARYVSDAEKNLANFNSSEFDEVYQAALAEVDDEKKVELFKQAQKIISDEAAGVYIQDIGSINIYKPGFDGFESYPLYANDFSAIYRTN